MLATLAVEAGRAISHLELADELWSGVPLSNPRNALQAQATRVRKVLGEPAQERERGVTVLRCVANGYVLDLPRDQIDGHRFLTYASEGAAALPDHPERALRLLETALGLWRGPALLDAGDGLRCRSAAALFEERRLTAWEDWTVAHMLLGDESRVIAQLRQLHAQYPLRERFCELLMLALYRVGRQGEALELFRRTRRRLDDELGIKPGMFLRRLHAEILAQDPVLTHPAAVWDERRSSGRYDVLTASMTTSGTGTGAVRDAPRAGYQHR